MRAAGRNAQLPLRALQNPAAAGKHAFRHGHGLMASADHMDDQPLAQKGLILRKQRGPGPVHRHRAAAPVAALRIKVAKSVFPSVQIGDLGTEQAVVFVGIGGKARRRYFGQVAFPAAHVAHVLNQLNRKDGQKGPKPVGHRFV